MQRYFFRFVAPTRLTFSSWETHQQREQKGVKNIYPEDRTEMLVFDKRIESAGFFHHYGLGFDVATNAPDRTDALRSAESCALKFMSVLTFLEQHYVGSPQLILSYRYPVTEGSRTLEEYSVLLVDDGYYQPTNLSLRPVNCAALRLFLESLISALPHVRDAIYFSLHWYWKAVGSEDRRDRFLHLWVALELLEASLKGHFDLPSKKSAHPKCSHCHETTSSCPHCGKDFSYNANAGFTGFKKLEKALTNVDGLMTFGTLHRQRSALVHSGGNVSVEILDRCIFSTRVLINAAILSLLDLPGERTHDAVVMSTKPFKAAVGIPMMIEFRGTAKVKGVYSVDSPENQPMASGRYSYEFEIREGDLVPHVRVEHQLSDVIEDLQAEKRVKVDASQAVKDVWEVE